MSNIFLTISMDIEQNYYKITQITALKSHKLLDWETLVMLYIKWITFNLQSISHSFRTFYDIWWFFFIVDDDVTILMG